MRSVIFGAAALIGLARAYTCGAQDLSAADRRDLIASVVEERGRLLAQEGLIDGCRANDVIGDSTVTLPSQFASVTVGRRAPQCLRREDIPRNAKLAVLRFESVRAESGEFIPAVGPSRPTPPGLIVVRLVVQTPLMDGSHVEEWVMRRARRGYWAAATVRMFMFGAG